MLGQGGSGAARRWWSARVTSSALDWSTISVVGDDAATYLDGQLSQDVSKAAAGCWSLVLQPTGELISSGWLRTANDGYEFLIPAELSDVTHTRLKRFLLRTKCEITIQDGASDPPIVTMADLETARRPWAAEIALGLLPHSYGRSFVDSSVSFTKGCFTGQELVGRMDARGSSAPWRFVVAHAKLLVDIDEALRAGPDGPKGVTTVFVHQPRVRVFGIAHRSVVSVKIHDHDVVIEEVN